MSRRTWFSTSALISSAHHSIAFLILNHPNPLPPNPEHRNLDDRKTADPDPKCPDPDPESKTRNGTRHEPGTPGSGHRAKRRRISPRPLQQIQHPDFRVRRCRRPKGVEHPRSVRSSSCLACWGFHSLQFAGEKCAYIHFATCTLALLSEIYTR